jgi:large subunit ribosomal protein L11
MLFCVNYNFVGGEPSPNHKTLKKRGIKMAKSKKKILGLIKLQIPAGKANPSPPVGPALGQKGLNIMEFCKAFNAQTQKMEPGIPVPVIITAYDDKSFTFITKLPPVAYFIKKAAGVQSASKEPGKTVAGQITMAQVKEIATTKLPDLNCSTVESAMNMVKGQAVSMGIKVTE